MRKIIAGSAQKSYGIHVAHLAGLPRTALLKAKAKLEQLEKKRIPKQEAQLTLFTHAPQETQLSHELKALDPLQLSPLQALERLISWKEKYGL